MSIIEKVKNTVQETILNGDLEESDVLGLDSLGELSSKILRRGNA